MYKVGYAQKRVDALLLSKQRRMGNDRGVVDDATKKRAARSLLGHKSESWGTRARAITIRRRDERGEREKGLESLWRKLERKRLMEDERQGWPSLECVRVHWYVLLSPSPYRRQPSSLASLAREI